MRFNTKDSAALLKESRETERQIYSWIDSAISPITGERDLIIEDVFQEGFNIRQKVLSVMRSYETPIKERLFEISGKSEALLRGMYERRDIVFESDAKQFFESSLAESVRRFSEWRSITETNSFINRRFIEWKTRRRGGGDYSRSERSQYTRRSSGETKRKAITDKQKLITARIQDRLSKEFESAIKTALAEKKEWIEDAEKFLKPQTNPAPFAISGLQRLDRGRSRHILLSDDGQALEIYTEDAPYE